MSAGELSVFVSERSSVVARVTARTSGDVHTARARAAAAVGWADLHPSSLHPSAVLCIRRARIPSAIGSAHDLDARRRFDRALGVTLDELARRAMRPADGFGGWCDAVVFDDVAELLACLARDWSAGRAADRWWWRVLLHGRVTIDSVASRFESATPHIAPAFERLAAWNEAAAFASTLDQRHVRALAAAVLRAHGGPSVEELFADRLTPVPLMTAADRAETRDADRIKARVISIAESSGATLSSTPLRRDQRALLAIAAVARQHVSLLRMPRFGEAFSMALHTIEARADGPHPPVAATLVEGPEFVERQHGNAITPDRFDEASPEGQTAPHGTGAELREDEGISIARADGAAASRDGVDPESSVARPAVQDSQSPPTAGLAALPILPFTDTPLGGVFYLLNVAIALRLYGDFTMPQRRGLRLSPWDFLALVSEHWLGEPLDPNTAGLLARLAGRAREERPGAGVIPADRLSRWLPRIVRRVNRHVARALGEWSEANVGRRLLHHDGRVNVTAAHVDLTFSLESLPIEIRRAGLDRDPGWIPSAGRIVRFHYI